ncbi:hypothetical protein ABZY57_20290 [Streptomyces sp. NPDC006450]|uniref:hypothetical protein n=1 Tax=Streptomyces sp. NPDC006450 TaxID=3155458 RepID=UPI0033B617B5
MRIRIAFQAVLTAVSLILLTPAVAHAHGDTVKVVVTGQREGHVTADVTWENDGDAVEEAVAATVNAVSADGARTLGPWRLVRDPAATPAGWTTAESLPPGAWKVSVDVGFPALGHGELEVGVPVVDPAPATGTPGPRPAGPSSAPTGAGTQAPTPTPTPTPKPATASEAPAEPGTGPAVWWTTAGVAVTALAGAAVGILLRRRRARG